MKKYIITLILLTFNLYGLQISSNKVKNANTILVQIEELNIKDPVVKFEDKKFKFYKNQFKKNSYYALVSIPYYQRFDSYKLLISYKKDKKRINKNLDIKVIDGNYKGEIIKVSKSKVTLSKKNQERTKKERDEALKIYNSISKQQLWRENFIYPIDSKITSHFGNKRVYNNKIKSYHGGTDFKAQIKTPIKAINDGIIKIAKNRFYAGNSIIIDHGNGIYSCYYHLNKLNYKVGQKVKRGDIIGLSGATGRVTGPHLHFSMWVNGILVDPLQLIDTLNLIKK